MLLSEPRVDYTVIELHPTMAANARIVFKQLGKEGKARVLNGPWEKMLATIPDHTYDVIFSDPWSTEREGDKLKWMVESRWDLPEQHLALPRVLKSGGSHVWYASPGFRGPTSYWHGLSEYPAWWQPTVYTDFAIQVLDGLRAYNTTTYHRPAQSTVFLPCGIK